ncbi:NADP-dependent oxidoreductase [Mucilaginibacter sp. HC2]|uniref:NADP-dependent oxidoreductase n=1 Tax=Mucilaginibacter inviolabilis TaxID=2714892 RepID=UPI0014091373|nr:NADP-dependent oxidoreductase [Mucilaginibacter inviolabilis]NHA03406.1 NADP-dependent oxidoreductase [Mucilaginibacter inviolabilis]
MKAIILDQPGGAENLKLATLNLPVIKNNEVLIQVKAISINPIDIKTRKGQGLYEKLKTEVPLILGWDISGIITQVGAEVNDFKVGEAVFGMINFPGHGKAYAEYVAVPAEQLAIKPANISHAEAAATTLAALTAYQSLIQHGKITRGQRVLIHAASGGVGHFAVQIARSLGAYVIGTASAANRDFVLSLGANEHVDYKAVRFEETLSDIDLVLDTVGGANTELSLQVTKKGGTVISIITGSSALIAEKAKEKGIHCYNTAVKSSGDDMRVLAKLLSNGALKPHIAQSFELDEISRAHQQIETGRTVGKIVVTL